jgi:hypothetical protein
VGRSAAYWAGNRYRDEASEPVPTAPLDDLPGHAAARFRALREGLLRMEDVGERVRYMGVPWRWTWEYGVGNRKLCWVHVIGSAISVTFTVSAVEEDRISKLPRLSADIARALTEAQRTGPVKWCWLELADRRAVDAFLRLAARKLEWLTERPVGHRAPRPRARRGQSATGETEGE